LNAGALLPLAEPDWLHDQDYILGLTDHLCHIS